MPEACDRLDYLDQLTGPLVLFSFWHCFLTFPDTLQVIQIMGIASGATVMAVQKMPTFSLVAAFEE